MHFTVAGILYRATFHSCYNPDTFAAKPNDDLGQKESKRQELRTVSKLQAPTSPPSPPASARPRRSAAKTGKLQRNFKHQTTKHRAIILEL